ncbi:MAG: hypothetical protein EHM46_06145, partial [Bacteroidetes bacterium]
MIIWNHNQPGYTGRGLRKIHIEFSVDGENWERLTCQDKDHWIIPEATGLNGHGPDLFVDFQGRKAKYVVISADLTEGNYGDDYYGLSEIKFLGPDPVPFEKMLRVRGTDIVLNRNGEQLRHYEISVSDGVAYGEDSLIVHYPEDGAEILQVGSGRVPFHSAGFEIPFDGEYSGDATLQISSLKSRFSRQFNIDPPRKWTIYLFPQSHVDLGYTHVQDQVRDLHFEFFEYAIELARRTRNYPEGSRFVWNTEVLWAVDHYLRENPPGKRKQLIEAVKKGWIHLDGSYANINTSLCNPELLFQLFRYAGDLETQYGLEINSAQQVDIPGLSWGVVPAMAQSGMKYMLNMPNIMEDQSPENYPFYWISPSGKSRILHFQTYYYNLGYHLKGRFIPNYLSGNTKPFHAENPRELFLDPFIFGFLEDLKAGGYNYGMVPFAWIMTDNAPPDPDLPDVVRAWNCEYENPGILISSAGRFFRDFESAYRDLIPGLRGDYTEHWTDGVASGARETALTRNNAERVLQLETLYTMIA